MKTTFLSQTLTDVLDDDDDEESFDSNNLTHTSHGGSLPNTSSAISELLDPRNSLPTVSGLPAAIREEQPSCDFEAAEHLTINDDAWNVKMNKPKPKDRTLRQDKPTFKKKMSLNIEPSAVKPLRNPKKSFSKTRSSLNLNTNTLTDENQKESLPDLETILLEKSRTHKVPETKGSSVSISTDIKTSIDIGWLDRNTAAFTETDQVTKSTSTLSAASSFGLSNLNMKSFTSNAEVKFHTLDSSDHEIVGNSDDEVEQVRSILHIAKKRRLSIEPEPEPSIEDPSAMTEEVEMQSVVPEKPKRWSVRKPRVQDDLNVIEEEVEAADEPEEPAELKEDDSPPPVLKRKRSVLKRSKDGIAKITKKATKLLTRNRKAPKEPEEEEVLEPVEQEINFLIDTDINNFKTVPRASAKELKTTEKLFDNYLKQHDAVNMTAKTIKVVDAKTAAKKEALEKKVASGTLNENFVRVNLKKKIFVRGKKAFSFSKYKKTVWKSKKAAALAGPEMDMRGCDGGVLKCFNCGGVGHFAQNCKQKGDNLLPIDAEVKDESPFPTLEEAAQMANDKKLVAHGSKPNAIPLSSNEIWKELNEDSDGDDEVEVHGANKENKDRNTEDTVAEAPKVT